MYYVSKSKVFLRFAGLGDALFVNTIAYHWWRETGRRAWVVGNHPEIFRRNPGAIVFPLRSPQWGIRFGLFLKRLGFVDDLTFLGYQPEGSDLRPLNKHIWEVLAEKAELSHAPSRPVLFLSDKEKTRSSLPQNGLPWVAMQSTGTTVWTHNKNWYPERFVEVALRLQGKARVVQLGLPEDPDLPSDLDLRGRISPREAAAAIASCKAAVCQEGYLMHAAAAVGTPAVVVFGGFIAPWESGYPWNVNLFSQLPCSPCWLTDKCPYEKKCMQRISPDTVIQGVQEVLETRSADVL